MADSLLKEVDDALRADRASALWQKHKISIIVFVVALVLGTAANSIWQQQREKHGARTLAALSENQQLLARGDASAAAKGFEKIARDSRGQIKALALVWQARAHRAAKQTPEAIAALKDAAGDGHTLWNDIACLRLAGLDAAAAAPCLSSTKKSPLSAMRSEWSAANLWHSGKSVEAMAALDALIAAADTPLDTKARLEQWRAAMNTNSPKTANE